LGESDQDDTFIIEQVLIFDPEIENLA